MKPYLLLSVAVLLGGLTSCHQGSDPTPAPDLWLGHWQADTLEIMFYDATGKLVDDHTFQQPGQLDVTTGTLTRTQSVNGQPVVDTQPYLRNGEALTLPNASAAFSYYCRQLTAATFTLEYNQKPIAGQPYSIQLVAYHR